MSWCKEYLAALQARDAHEQANQEIYNSYTKLADRTAQLESSASASVTKSTPSDPTSPTANASSLAKLKADLTEAQRNRGELQTRLAQVTSELENLQHRAQAEERRIVALTAEKTALGKRMRDRDEELRGKAKLLEDIHDEQVALTLQLNVSEEQNGKLRAENKELVDRWMARMGQEAEAMNTASKFS